MARPKGFPPELVGEPSDGPGEDAPEVPDPLAGFHLRPGARGPRTTLTRAMIPIIAESLARTGVQRIAAAKAGTTEDCLGKWLSKGRDAVARRKSSLYTELLFACETTWAHPPPASSPGSWVSPRPSNSPCRASPPPRPRATGSGLPSSW